MNSKDKNDNNNMKPTNKCKQSEGRGDCLAGSHCHFARILLFIEDGS